MREMSNVQCQMSNKFVICHFAFVIIPDIPKKEVIHPQLPLRVPCSVIPRITPGMDYIFTRLPTKLGDGADV